MFNFQIIPIVNTMNYSLVMPNGRMLVTRFGYQDEWESDISLYEPAFNDEYVWGGIFRHKDAALVCVEYVRQHFKNRQCNITIHPR